MSELGIEENDLREKFIIGSGSGGQKLHKTASCVYLQHQPSGTAVKCQQSRLREDNRYYARKRLCDKIDLQLNRKKSQIQQAIEKIRQQKKRRSRRSKEKMLAEKKHRSTVKKARQVPKDPLDNEE